MTVTSITKNNLVFTFTDAMVPKINTTISPDPYKTQMPGSGPSSNIANDFNGVEKTLTLTIQLVPTTSSVVTGPGAPTITTVKQMKYYLESLTDGAQTAMTFTSNYEEYSVIASSNTCTIDGVSGTIDGEAIPAAWGTTKVYITGMTFGEDTTPDYLDCTITLWVAGY